MRNKPSYVLESVDNALVLLQMLRDQGSLRVSEAAEELGAARSTAHRLLSMLVYRDFAVQDENRCYLPGPALFAPAVVGGPPLRRLRKVMLPHLDALCDRVGETVNLMVRVGTQARFVATVESTQLLRVGDRQGTIMPARNVSGGKALLAALSDDELAELYLAEDGETAASTGSDDAKRMLPSEYSRFLDEIRATRRRGYGLNREETESGVCAIGRRMTDSTRSPIGAVSVAVPSQRFTKDRIAYLDEQLRLFIERARPSLDLLNPGA